MVASEASHFPAPLASLCAWGAPAAQFNLLMDSGQGGTAGMEGSFAPEIILESKVLTDARSSKNGETPHFIALSKIATRGLEAQSSNVCSGV